MIKTIIERTDKYEFLRNNVTLIINILDVSEREEVYCAEVMYEADIFNGYVGMCIVQVPDVNNEAEIIRQILEYPNIVDKINSISDAELETMDHDEWQKYYNPMG